MSILVAKAGISGKDRYFHLMLFSGMQLYIPVWDICFWHQSLHLVLRAKQYLSHQRLLRSTSRQSVEYE